MLTMSFEGSHLLRKIGLGYKDILQTHPYHRSMVLPEICLEHLTGNQGDHSPLLVAIDTGQII